MRRLTIYLKMAAMAASASATTTKKSRGRLWSDKKTKDLLEAWSDEVIQVALENAKTPKQSNKVYNTLLVSCVTVCLKIKCTK